MGAEIFRGSKILHDRIVCLEIEKKVELFCFGSFYDAEARGHRRVYYFYHLWVKTVLARCIPILRDLRAVPI